MNLSEKNKKSFDLIEKSIMVLNLDESIPLTDEEV